MTINEKVKIIKLPREGEFKVVQLFLDNQPYLLCGNSFHKDILEYFLIKMNIDYLTIQVPKHPNLTMPALKGGKDEYKVVGMGGAATMASNPPAIELPRGRSHDYNIPIDKEFNKLIKNTLENYEFL